MRVSTTVKIARDIDLYVLDCCTCGVVFGMPVDYKAARQRDKALFCCPNGHQQGYGENEADRLRRELEAARQATAAARTDSAEAWRSVEQERKAHASTKGQLTKARKRACAGVCLHCHRTFANVARHMQTKHAEQVAAVKRGGDTHAD